MQLWQRKMKEHFVSIQKIRRITLLIIKGELLDNILATITDLDNTSKLQVVHERRLLAEAGFYVSFHRLNY